MERRVGRDTVGMQWWDGVGRDELTLPPILFQQASTVRRQLPSSMAQKTISDDASFDLDDLDEDLRIL